jgi:hypothetical protein
MRIVVRACLLIFLASSTGPGFAKVIDSAGSKFSGRLDPWPCGDACDRGKRQLSGIVWLDSIMHRIRKVLGAPSSSLRSLERQGGKRQGMILITANTPRARCPRDSRRDAGATVPYFFWMRGFAPPAEKALQWRAFIRHTNRRCRPLVYGSLSRGFQFFKTRSDPSSPSESSRSFVTCIGLASDGGSPFLDTTGSGKREGSSPRRSVSRADLAHLELFRI